VPFTLHLQLRFMPTARPTLPAWQQLHPMKRRADMPGIAALPEFGRFPARQPVANAT